MNSIKLNNIDIMGCSVINTTVNHFYKTSKIKLFFWLIKHIFIQKYAFNLKGNHANILFLNGLSTHRTNDMTTFSKIKLCAKNYDEIIVSTKLRPANFIANIITIFSCYKKMRDEDLLPEDKLLYCVNAVRTKGFIHYLNTLDCSNYCCGVVYNDLETFDNVFVQYLKNNGIGTITCQHGAFTAPLINSDNYLDAGIELTYSIADIFMAWNQMTYDEAIKAGMDPKRLYVLGIPKCIGEEKIVAHHKTGYFGVILNIKERQQENLRMIQIANIIAKKINKKYYLKLHPNLQLDEYNNIIDHEWGKVLPKSISVADYAQLVDFSILTASSVYVELIFYKCRVYKLRTDVVDKFPKFHQYDFSNDTELLQLLDKEYDISQVFNYYCHTVDPQRSYETFFDNIRNSSSITDAACIEKNLGMHEVIY